MTLIAALRCTEGLVISGDSEENRGAYRRSVQKISPSQMGNFEIVVGASGVGDLIDAFILRLEDTVSKSAATTIPELKSLIEDQLVQFYAVDSASYPADTEQNRQIKCIIGARSVRDCGYEAWISKHVVLSPVTTYELAGIEDVIYDHVIKRLCMPGMTLAQGVLAGAYLFTIAKETSTYIRGATSIAVIREKGITLESRTHVEAIESRLVKYETNLNKLFLACADTSVSPKRLNDLLSQFSSAVQALHKSHIDAAVLDELASGWHVTNPYSKIPPKTLVRITGQGAEIHYDATDELTERVEREIMSQYSTASRADHPPHHRARPDERVSNMTNHGGKRPGAGRPRTNTKRCPCGAMTAKCAEARGHKCEKEKTTA